MVTAAAPIERARTLLALRRPAEAERELRGLLAQDPQNVDGHAFLAVALTEQRRPGEAIDAAAEAVRLAPDRSYPHYVAGQAYHRAGRPREAADATRACLALTPEYAPAWELLARVHVHVEQWPQAADAARQGLALEPEDADLASLLAVALTMLGDAAGAKEAAARAVGLDPESAIAHLAYGRAQLAFGSPGEAARAFREVLRLAPGFDQARDLLVAALKRRNPVYRLLARLRGTFFGGWRMLFLLPVVPPVITLFVLIALLHWAAWVAEAVTTLRLARAGATRLLFEGTQARVALVCCCLLAAGAALLVTGVAAGQEVIGVAGAAVMALITPVQEAAHTSAPRGRAVLYGWAILLGLAAALAVLLSSPSAALLAAYAGLAGIWVAAGVRRLTGTRATNAL
ncbi:tetratricopeptide repeat protein [Microbispora sp. NEAU-D428]|uniref:tetratricopeptide repeat protein n=1 Tax=Microbispora sitophila TaxID=2771537 RepID=UPI001865C61D|nr:tetratricopeptide repeat protein [Microbispora sitophila]MBE3010488.1 tetratricopeptide repeat protein [Microbispora sitophila]